MTTKNDIISDIRYRPYLDHGFVGLIDIMGCDRSIDRAARVSYGGNDKERTTEEITQLIRYLYRNRHTSPFEMVELLFHIKLPIFVMRQHVRHRTACLAGSTILDFDGGGSKNAFHRFGRRPITVKEIYDRWVFGGFGNKREDYDLSFVNPDEYYTSHNIGEWFKNRKFIADSQGLNVKMKAKNGKVIDHYKGCDVLSFYERQKKEGYNNHKDILKHMSLRSLDEETKCVYHTNITDIWKTGKKLVYEIRVGDGNQYQRTICASEDHLFFTELGWKKLSEISVGDRLWTCRSHDVVNQKFDIPEVLDDEIWTSCYQFEEYLISSYGRIKRVKFAKGAKIGKIKIPTFYGDRMVIGLSKNGKTTAHNIHRLVLLSFKGESENSFKNMCCHKNGNPLDNRLENLYWGDAQDNSNDMILHGTSTRLGGKLLEVKSKELRGEEDTYDIEVSGPFHNFVANSFVVHNSLNEYSGRYSVMSNEFYLPDKSREFGQSTNNKQQSSGFLSEAESEEFLNLLNDSYETAYNNYRDSLGMGISKELARLQLPVSNYTELYWKIDLHNFFHYTSLRNDPGHAQNEIVQLAQLMYDLVKPHVPISCQAFEDYQFNGIRFSVQEQKALAELLKIDDFVQGAMNDVLNQYLKGREQEEFKNKISKIIERK